MRSMLARVPLARLEILVGLGLSLALWGCSKEADHPPDLDGVHSTVADASETQTNACAGGVAHEGCHCEVAGTQAECGELVTRSGTYITCSMGTSTCDGAQWGPCVGTHYVNKGTQSARLIAPSKHVFSTSAACADPCDPNPNCTNMNDSPGDIDASGVYPDPEGGYTLSPGDATILDEAHCTGMQCYVASCGGNPDQTTLSGIVYDPAGKNPLYNVTVYVPVDRDSPLPAFTTGVTCDTCAGSTLNAVTVTTTAANGTFTLKHIPYGSDIPIVVQSGKWRREIRLGNVSACTANTLGSACQLDASLCTLRLPRNQTDGYDRATKSYTHADLPQMAIVTGAVDPLECMMLKAGISPSEFSSYDAHPANTLSAKVHFFQSDNAAGTKLDPHFGNQVKGSKLWVDASPSTVAAPHYNFYDAVLFPCEGAAIDKEPLRTTGTGEPYQNLIRYTDLGGRAFVTHYGYVWLEYPSYKNYVTGSNNWSGVANWISRTGTTATQDPLTANIVTSFTKGHDFADWLLATGASTTLGQIKIHEGREDLTTVGSGAQSWMTAVNSRPPWGVTGNTNEHFTFNTPYGAAASGQCGRVVFSDFHVSASALVTTGPKTCYEDSQCGFGQTCSGHTGTAGSCDEPCKTPDDCPDATYTCEGATAGKCLPKSCTPGGYTCTIGACHNNTSCWCTDNSQCPSGKCVNQGQCTTGTCTGSAGTADGTSCQPDTATACTASTSYVCSDPKFACTSGSGNCPVTTGTIAAPTYACSDATKTCNSAHKCVCVKNSDCASGVCINVDNQCTGTCTAKTSSTNYDENYCQIPTAIPSAPDVGGAKTCGSSTAGCNSGGTSCALCTSDTQCVGSRNCCLLDHSYNSCMYTYGADPMGCYERSPLSQTPAMSRTCSVGYCYSPSNYAECACNADSQCGKTGSANDNCGSITDSSTDYFGCTYRGSTAWNWGGPGSNCPNGAWVWNGGNWYRCVCNSDADCGINSACYNVGQCSGGACSANTNYNLDEFYCTYRGSYTSCNYTYSCSTGASNSNHSKCWCTDDNQCGSGSCASWSGCTGTCSGAAGAGDGDDNCVFACTQTNSTCSIGTAHNGACWCTDNNQCASKKCATWSGCTGTCSGTAGSGGTDNCVAETTWSATCSPSVCTGGTVLGTNGSCWCTNDNQCSTGACVPWTSGSNGCSGPNCTGTGTPDANHCQSAKPTCSTNTSYACSAVGTASCNTAHNCVCTSDAQCPTGSTCNPTAATANAFGCTKPTATIPNACLPSSYTCDAPAVCDPTHTYCWCTADAQCASGQCVDWTGCSAGNCTGTGTADNAHCVPFNATDCSSDGDCGFSGSNVEFCSGAEGGTAGLGKCACTSSTNCGAGQRCTGGRCVGCTSGSQCTGRTYPASCAGGSGAVSGNCCKTWDSTSCGLNAALFPEACLQSPMSDQEKALEFMFFDLTACVTPDQGTSTPPPTLLSSQTFSLDFSASCPTGTSVRWRELDYQVSFPSPVNGASIAFAAQTGPLNGTSSTFLPSTALPLVTATTNTALPQYDAVLLDTAPGGSGLFTTASPPVASNEVFRLWVTMNPTTDQLNSPTLKKWNVVYDCPWSQ